MKLFLQFGFGMMKLSKELIKTWGEGTVILSPRDLEPEQLPRFSKELHRINGETLLDPQFYLPRSDHHRLTKHGYWPNDYETSAFPSAGQTEMLDRLIELNEELGTSHFIVPGLRAASIDDVWLDSQNRFYEASTALTNKPLLVTICLSEYAIRNEDQITKLLSVCEQLQAFGYYLMIEPPANSYLVDDPIWLAHILDLCASLKRQGSKVIYGCGNHQQLILSCAAIDAISSGTWLNVRSFVPDKYRTKIGKDDQSRRATWYYCPQTLTEYKLPYVDLAFEHGLIEKIKPNPSTPYSEGLFQAHNLVQVAGVNMNQFDTTYALLKSKFLAQFNQLLRVH